MISRRELLNSLTNWSAEQAACLAVQGEFVTESQDSPFFEHFHFLSIPVSALSTIPENGITLKTSTIDLASYDQETFKRFITETGLNAEALLKHSHEVKIDAAKLQAIADGQKSVEIRVISANGNYVHNFLITASPMILATVRKAKAKKEVL
ncbi:hypothetical protein [Bdellovibrio sp. HCB274]|uniref:hypothetical protein n=1 Tax=Bdellovibrio sp. HCB274 TaxID=3394361 RepID=UPI0039B6658C